jgi:hypothetical protein
MKLRDIYKCKFHSTAHSNGMVNMVVTNGSKTMIGNGAKIANKAK